MSVHVNPGVAEASFISSGSFKFVGDFWVDFLGRASVATLSFLSGYLLVKTASSKPWKIVARDKFNILIVPMLFWNTTFVILQFCKAELFSGKSQNFLDQNIGAVIASFTGINGPTANLSLFFLRDIFVSLVLVKIGMSLLSKCPFLIISGILAVTIFDLLEPLVFRPSILLFSSLGAVFALRGYRIINIGNHKGFIFCICACLIALYLYSNFFAQKFPAQYEIENLAKRGVLVILMLITTVWISESPLGDIIGEFETSIFETYLSHVIVFSVLWTVWVSLGGSAHYPSYLAFFLIMPFTAIIIGSKLGQFIDTCPAWFQRLLRGRAKVPRLISTIK